MSERKNMLAMMRAIVVRAAGRSDLSEAARMHAELMAQELKRLQTEQAHEQAQG